MSSFVVIAPSEYTHVDRDTWINATGIPFEAWNNVSQERLESAQGLDIVPEGQYILEAITLDTEIYVKFADIPE